MGNPCLFLMCYPCPFLVHLALPGTGEPVALASRCAGRSGLAPCGTVWHWGLGERLSMWPSGQVAMLLRRGQEGIVSQRLTTPSHLLGLFPDPNDPDQGFLPPEVPMLLKDLEDVMEATRPHWQIV